MKITGRKIHAMWSLLSSLSVGSGCNSGDSDSLDGGSADAKGKLELVDLGSSLGLLQSSGATLSLTNHGESFASAWHWRDWTVPRELRGRFEDLGIGSWFLGDGSWVQRPKVVDLFSGAGGLSLGFETAGFAVHAAVDVDEHACGAYSLNFPRSKVVKADVRQLAADSGVDIWRQLDIERDSVAGVVGGPPCQGFSHIGERLLNDPRNELVDVFLDVVLNIRPFFFVFESVPALLSFGIRPTLDSFLARRATATGSAAVNLVDALPESDGATSRRVRQRKRRLLSHGISCTREAVADLLIRGDTNLSLSDAALFAFDFLLDDVHNSVAQVYSEKLLADARAIVNTQRTNIAAIAIALSVTELVQRRLIDGNETQSEVAGLAYDVSLVEDLRVAAKETIEAYQALENPSNYRGVTIGPKMRDLLRQVSCHYDVYHPLILNAADYGTPQRRERLFVIGIRLDEFAKASSRAPLGNLWDDFVRRLQFFRCAAVTSGEVLDDLPDVDGFEHLVDSDIIEAVSLSRHPSPIAERLRLERIDEADKSMARSSWSPDWIDGCKRTLHTREVVARIQALGQGERDSISKRTRLQCDSPSQTLRAGTLQEKGSHTAVRPIHYRYHRVVSVRESARLMGYPDWMTFHSSNWHGSRLVGNGVPLKLGSAIGTALWECLFDGE